MKIIDFKNAYTLAEVVMAMIIVGLIVGITTGITRSKIDRAQKYNYYAAYTTLTSLMSEMFADNDGTMPSDICSEFESRLNLYPNDITINGSEITPSCDTTCDISDVDDLQVCEPNIVTRNGMKFYNLSADSVIMSSIGDASQDDAIGYLIYVDIDGERNSTIIYEDVFPFFLTRSAKVIPIYPTDSDSAAAGGNSTDSMAFSVNYETVKYLVNVSVNKYPVLTTKWIVKGVSFQEAACKSGYLPTSCSYCEDYSVDDDCEENGLGLCTLVPLKPIKYFVK